MKVEIFIQYQGDRYSQMLKLHQRTDAGGAACTKLKTRLTKGVQKDLSDLGLDEGDPTDVQFQWKFGKARSFWEVEPESALHHRLQALLHGIHLRLRDQELESRSISSVTLKEDDKRVRMKGVAQRVKAREQALSATNAPQDDSNDNAGDNAAHTSTQAAQILALSTSNNNIAALASDPSAPKPVVDAQPKRKRQESENQPDRADPSARPADPRRAAKRAKLSNADLPIVNASAVGVPAVNVPAANISAVNVSVANPPPAASGSRDLRTRAIQGYPRVTDDADPSDEARRVQADLKRVRAERDAAYADNHKLAAQYREHFSKEKAKFEAEERRLREQIREAAGGRAAPHQSPPRDLARREKEALQAVWDDERQCLQTEIQELRDRLAGTTTAHSADIIKKIKADHEFSLRQAVAAEHTRYADTNAQLTRDLGRARSDLADARAGLERARREAQAAQGELARMDAHHARLARQCAELRAQNEALAAARDEGDAQMRGLEARLAGFGKALEEREGEVQRLEAGVAALREERDAGADDEVFDRALRAAEDHRRVAREHKELRARVRELEEQTGASPMVFKDAAPARSRQPSAAGTAEVIVCRETVLALTQEQVRGAELETVKEEGEI